MMFQVSSNFNDSMSLSNEIKQGTWKEVRLRQDHPLLLPS